MVTMLRISYCHAWMSQPRQSFATTKKMPGEKATNARRYFATPDENDDDDDDGWDDTTELDFLRGQRTQSIAEQKQQQQQERDLFIPIVSLVSLAGLFGTYAYEMLRLYSRGELYLPWEH